jgi:hypothetical protein
MASPNIMSATMMYSDSGPHPHQAMVVQDQLPYIPIFRSWHPNAGKVVF